VVVPVKLFYWYHTDEKFRAFSDFIDAHPVPKYKDGDVEIFETDEGPIVIFVSDDAGFKVVEKE